MAIRLGSPHYEGTITDGRKILLTMVRIQLDMPDERVQELDALMKTTGAATRKELFNNALTLLEWAVKERKQGRIIASIDEDAKRIKELVMPALEKVAAEAPKLALGSTGGH